MLSRRLLLRLAAKLQSAWLSRSYPDPSEADWERLEVRLRHLRETRHRFDLAIHANLSLILPSLRSELVTALTDLDRQISSLRNPLSQALEADEPNPRHSLADWLAELRQLGEEFDNFTVNWKTGTVSVCTERITLKDVPLGRFKLVFHWSRVGLITGSRCFDLIALDPNPARGKDGVTHPHIQDEELCAGDAARPLDEAVKNGRLADAFLLLRSVLTTYNPRSPYVSLDEWDGTSCSECGSSVDPDERSFCDACHAELCDGCVRSCSACSDYRCPSCLNSCEECHTGCCPGCLTTIEKKSFCPDCFKRCSQCQTPTPQEELSDDDRCPTCLEPSEDSIDDQSPTVFSLPPDPSDPTNPFQLSFPLVPLAILPE